MKALVVAALLAAFAARPGIAVADPSAGDLAEADRLLREGNSHYAAGRHDQAIAAYGRAHALTGAPGFLFNIAQVHRVAGNCREAIDHYERFLAADPRSPLRSKVERFLADLWRCVEEERRTQSSKEPEPAPQASAASPPPPARATGAITATAAPPAERGAASSATRWRWIGLGAAAMGGLAVGGGVYLGLESRSAARDTERFDGEWGPAQEAAESGAARDERNAIILTATGGAVLAIGLALFAWSF